jgi:hypothetical protein
MERIAMFAIYLEFFQAVSGIFRLEQGPKDLPYSAWGMGLSLVAYALVKFGVEYFKLPMEAALLSSLADTLVMVLLAGGALLVRGVGRRIPQTLMACAVVGSLINLVALLATALMSLSPMPLTSTYALRVFTFPVIAWNVIVNAHILRQALSSGFVLGFVLSLIIFAAAWGVTTAISPDPGPINLGTGALGRRPL